MAIAQLFQSFLNCISGFESYKNLPLWNNICTSEFHKRHVWAVQKKNTKHSSEDFFEFAFAHQL